MFTIVPRSSRREADLRHYPGIVSHSANTSRGRLDDLEPEFCPSRTERKWMLPFHFALEHLIRPAHCSRWLPGKGTQREIPSKSVHSVTFTFKYSSTTESATFLPILRGRRTDQRWGSRELLCLQYSTAATQFRVVCLDRSLLLQLDNPILFSFLALITSM